MSRRRLPHLVTLVPIAFLFLALATPCRGGFARFDQVTDTIQFPGNITATSFTVEARIRLCGPVATSSAYSVIWTEQYNGLEDRSLTAGTQGFGGSGFPITGHTIAWGTISRNDWHHIVWQVAGGRKTLYLDGVRVSDQAAAGSVGTAPGAIAAIGGFKEPAGDQSFRSALQGDLDFLRISSGGRYSGATITALVADPPTDGTTLANFNFNEPNGSLTVADSGPNGWTGTLGTGYGGATSPELLSVEGASRLIRTTGTVAILGRITIETFNKPTFPRSTGRFRPKSTSAMEMVTCTVTPGMNQVQVSAMLRDSLNAQLSGTWTADLADPNTVMLFSPGPFTIGIMNTAGGIVVQEVAEPTSVVPTLGEWGVIALAGLLFLMGAAVLSRRSTARSTG